MDMDHPAAYRSGEDQRPPWMSDDGEMTTTTPSPSPAWLPSSPTEFHLGRIYSPPHRYFAPMMMGLDVAGDGNLLEYQSEPAISAAALSVRWSPQPPSPQPWSPTMDVRLWSFTDRPISSPEELGLPAVPEAILRGFISRLLIRIQEEPASSLILLSDNQIDMFKAAMIELIRILERLECTVMIGSKELPELVRKIWEMHYSDEDRLAEIWEMHYSGGPFERTATSEFISLVRLQCTTVIIGSKELSEFLWDAVDRLTEILDMHYSNSRFKQFSPERLRECIANKVEHVEQTSVRLIMGCSSSAEVDNAADKCSGIPGASATTLLGIENPRQRQEDKATASLSPLSSRKKIVEITNAKSGGDNNEVAELLGHTDVEADKPASSVSRKRIRSQGRKSRAWPHFPNVERNAANRITKAQCTYCDTWLEADTKRNGTSRLLRHITHHHKMDVDASPETNKNRMALAIKTKNQSRDQTAPNWGGNDVSILDSQDSVGKISRLEGQLLDKINSASQEGILVPDEEDDDATAERDEYVLQRRAAERNDVEDSHDIREVTTIAGSGPRRPTTASRNTQGKEENRLKRSARIEEMRERFPQMREEESARLAREKEAAESNDFSIKRCISVLNTLEVTKEEKAKAYAVFSKSKENREIFICSCEADVESTLIWLRNEMVYQGDQVRSAAPHGSSS